MKKIYTLMICFILIGCGSQKNTDIAAKTETATETNTKKEIEEPKEEPKEEYIVEKGGALEFSEKDGEGDFLFTSKERSGSKNSYAKKMNNEKLDEGEKFYHLTLKIKSTGKEAVSVEPGMFQLETEDGTLYKNTMDYTDVDNVSSVSDSYNIDPILANTSKEIKLNYRIKGEVKSIDFVYRDQIVGRLMLK